MLDNPSILKYKILLIDIYRICLLCLFLFACPTNEYSHPVLRLGFIPFESNEELLKNVQPLIDVIEKGMNMEVQPFIAADYAGVIEAFKGGKLDVAFMSPASYVLGHQEAGIQVILKSQRDWQAFYYGAIIVRSESSIQKLEDLKEKRFSFSDPLSTSGHIFPRKILFKYGINPTTDFENVIFSGSHDATILAVLNKKVDAGATYADDNQGKSNAWTRFLKPDEQKQIRVLAYSEPIPRENICVRKDFPAEKMKQFQDTLLHYSSTPEGKKLMRERYKMDGYVIATHQDYAAIKPAFELAGIPLEKTLKKN